MNVFGFNNKYFQIIILIIIVALGVFYVRTVWVKFENEENNKIMQLGRSIAVTLPQNYIKALDAVPGDCDKPQYLAIKKILRSLIEINKHSKFAYIFSERNGKLYFMADSEPEGSQSGSPAGQEYYEATPTDLRLFEVGSTPIIEHSSDRWGEWVSVLVPIKDAETGKILAVFGVDFEKKTWDAHLIQELVQSSIIVILLLVAFLFLFVIEKKNILLKEDISKRIQVEAALRESQSLYLSFVEQLPNPVFRKDREGRYVLVNSPFCKLKGLEMDDFIGKNPVEIVPKEMAVLGAEWKDTILENVDDDIHQQIIRTRESFSSEEVYPTVHGEIKNKLVVRMPVVDSVGVIVGSQGIMFDITELKRAEHELIKAKEKAEESDRLKLAFLTNMTHEIRTPMSTILGFADLLKDPNLSGDEHQTYIQYIEQSGARMLSTINDIICISKIQSGQLPVSIAETDINELLWRTYALFKPDADTKGLDFKIINTLSPNEVLLQTDGEKIGIILSNLVSNALKFTRKGSVIIEYFLKEAEIEFKISDTGTGIGPESAALIFENFRQGSEAYTRNYEGVGLGLSISKALVEMLGGKIWMNSELGKGSDFMFTIPLRKV
ncbi:MAG: ATP-binding protein [Bacteroidales bacterium]|nr:ATP-binding protein [Bacteroidales bacterium]